MSTVGTVAMIAAVLATPQPGPVDMGRAAAEARWGPAPCDVTVERRHLPGWWAGEARYSTDGDTLWDCVIVIDTKQLTPAEECAVTMHEYGHLHGLEHSDDPRSVMHSPLQVIPRPCRRAA
jgi:hypothetical protein